MAGAFFAAGADTGVETGAATVAGTEPAAVVLDWVVAAAEGTGSRAAFFLAGMAGDFGVSSGEKTRLVMISIFNCLEALSRTCSVLWYNCGHESSKQVGEL